MSIYDFSFLKPNGEKVEMENFKNRVILVVNTATKCGYTPQFKGLEDLHKKYESKGLTIIGFPCNQFLNQEPETNETLEEVCLQDHGVTFTLSEKIKVNGGKTHPLYKFLKDALPRRLTKRIAWNFTKFLVDKDGTPLKRYGSRTTPEELEPVIAKLLQSY